MDGQLATIELSLEAAVRNILLLIEDLVGQVLAALADPHSLVHNAVGPIILSMSFVYVSVCHPIYTNL